LEKQTETLGCHNLAQSQLMISPIRPKHFTAAALSARWMGKNCKKYTTPTWF